MCASASTEWTDMHGVTYYLYSNGEASVSRVGRNVWEVLLPEKFTAGEYGEYTLTSIEPLAFTESDVIAVYIRFPLKAVDERMFDGCKNLSSIILPETVTSIGDYAFRGCAEMRGFAMPPQVTSIGASAFEGTSLMSLSLPERVTSIGASAFEGTSIVSLSLPESVTSIGEGAFRNCSKMRRLDFNASVSEIPSDMFAGCTSLTMVNIGEHVSTIGTLGQMIAASGFSQWYDSTDAFPDSPLTEVTINSTKPPYWYLPLDMGVRTEPAIRDRGKRIRLYVPREAVDVYRNFNYDIGYNEVDLTGNNPTVYAAYPYACTYSRANVFGRGIRDFDTPYFENISPIAEPGGVERIELEPAGSPDVPVTQSVKINVRVYPEGAEYDKIVFTSSNPDIFTVDDDGVATAVGTGDAVITARISGTDIMAEQKVYGYIYVPNTIVPDRSSLILGVKGSYRLDMSCEPAEATRLFTYESTDTDIATVDADGTVKAHRRGSCTVLVHSARTEFREGVTCEVPVTVVPQAQSIIINLPQSNLVAGGEPMQLGYTIIPAEASGQIVEWSSDREEEVAVDRYGKVTPLAHADAYITATTSDGCSDCVRVVVDYAEVEDFAVPETVELITTDVYTLRPSVIPATACPDLSIKVSDTTVVYNSYAYVDGFTEYILTALKEGEATVTVSTPDGRLSKTVKVTVGAGEPYSVELNHKEISFDADGAATTPDAESVWVCIREGLYVSSWEPGYPDSYNENFATGCRLSVTGTVPDSYSERLAAVRANMERKYGLTERYTYTDVTPYWTSSDERVAKVYPIGDFSNYYVGGVYEDYALRVAVVPGEYGTAVISYYPYMGAPAAATCMVYNNTEASLDGTAVGGAAIAASGRTIVFSGFSDADMASVVTPDGRVLYQGAPDTCTVPYPGVYICTCGGITRKIAVR